MLIRKKCGKSDCMAFVAAGPSLNTYTFGKLLTLRGKQPSMGPYFEAPLWALISKKFKYLDQDQI